MIETSGFTTYDVAIGGSDKTMGAACRRARLREAREPLVAGRKHGDWKRTLLLTIGSWSFVDVADVYLYIYIYVCVFCLYSYNIIYIYNII